MGNSALPKDYMALAEAHGRLMDGLRQAAWEGGAYEQQVLLAVEEMKKWTLGETLRAIPLEELNREKRGIRVAALRSSGYENFQDLDQASLQELAAVNGISDDGAGEIKFLINTMVYDLKKDLKIRLSGDQSCSQANDLILSLLKYQKIQKIAPRCLSIGRTMEPEISRAMEDLPKSSNPLRWLFTSREKKEKALRAYEYLQREETQGYAPEAGRLTAEAEAIRSISAEEAHKAFEISPIPFITELERLCPGVLGNDDGLYGLPEELAAEVQKEELPLDGLTCSLRRYQQLGVQYILHQKNVLLGDEMGLGKTVQAIAAMVALRNSGGSHFLVICPASVIENWVREIRKHSDLTPVKIHGEDREEQLALWLSQGGVAVTNYETAKIFTLPEDFRIHMVIVDEAHYIKNPSAQRTGHVKAICSHGDRLLFMTGTAMENRVEEMIVLLKMLNGEVGQRAEEKASLSSAPQFQNVIAPVYYRRKRETVLTELPELIEKEEWCELLPREEQVYEELVLEGAYMKCRRVSWNAPTPQDSSKARRLLEILEDAREDGRKVIVFSFFLDTIERIRTMLGSRCLEPINGSVPVSRRQQIIDEFQKAPAGTVLPAQIQAGGTGLNIQCASVVVLCEPQLKPSIENQAISRAYRMGQSRNVLVFRLLAEDTVDEGITQMLLSKQAEFDTYADESAAARESLQLDQAAFKAMMQQEAQRIQAKRGLTVPDPQALQAPAEPTEKESKGEPNAV